MTGKLIGLVAATHTPFDTHGQLNLAAVEKQAEAGVSEILAASLPRWETLATTG